MCHVLWAAGDMSAWRAARSSLSSLCSLLRSPSYAHWQFTLRHISQICHLQELLHITYRFLVLVQQLLLQIKKKTSLEKTLDMTADWTAHHLSLWALPVLKMFPLNRSYFIPLAEMKMRYSTIRPGKLAEKPVMANSTESWFSSRL